MPDSDAPDSMPLPEYSAFSIKVLTGPDAIRARPAMYIGSVDDDGVHHLLWEVVGNVVDNHLGGVEWLRRSGRCCILAQAAIARAD